jgi:hypothetical protein
VREALGGGDLLGPDDDVKVVRVFDQIVVGGAAAVHAIARESVAGDRAPEAACYQDAAVMRSHASQLARVIGALDVLCDPHRRIGRRRAGTVIGDVGRTVGAAPAVGVLPTRVARRL